jgi:hypothetical protein
MEDDKFVLKNTGSSLGKNLEFFLPLIEEITNNEVMPMCVVGLKKNEQKEKTYQAYFATHNGTMDKMLYDICKAYVDGYEKNKVEFIP